ncbi:MAG: alpha/beta hydrolase [Phycisphaera sp.]|nr:MAG: alpha/beta hydrolase [Phycisphaera sp.]
MLRVEFAGALGDRLAARLDEPEAENGVYALFAHCFTCSKDIAAASRIARGLAERGIGVLRFDFTGLGHSDGEFANTSFSSNVGDLVAAAAWLRAERQAPTLLIGHSLGGAAVLAAADQIPESTAVITIGAPADPAHVTHLFGDEATRELEERGRVQVSIGGRPFSIGRGLLDDLRSQEPAQVVGGLNRALLVMHAPGDAIVGIENAAQIYQWAKHPKSFVSLDDADHLLTRSQDAQFVADLIAAWAPRYSGKRLVR